MVSYLEPQTTIKKWMFGETTISYVKIGNHPIETTIYKWLFGVPGMSYTWLKFGPPINGRREMLFLGEFTLLVGVKFTPFITRLGAALACVFGSYPRRK